VNVIATTAPAVSFHIVPSIFSFLAALCTRGAQFPAASNNGTTWNAPPIECYRTARRTAFVCADITMNAIASEHSDVHESLHRNAEFWALVSHALHTSVFVTLRRLLDDGSARNVYDVLNCARSNPERFSRSAQAARVGSASSTP
jgi:hypothetical protein